MNTSGKTGGLNECSLFHQNDNKFLLLYYPGKQVSNDMHGDF